MYRLSYMVRALPTTFRKLSKQALRGKNGVRSENAFGKKAYGRKPPANKIINKGDVGRVVAVDGNMLQVQLNDKTQAMDGNWKQLAGPGQNVLMFTESDNVKIGDKVVIQNEDLCLKKDIFVV